MIIYIFSCMLFIAMVMLYYGFILFSLRRTLKIKDTVIIPSKENEIKLTNSVIKCDCLMLVLYGLIFIIFNTSYFLKYYSKLKVNQLCTYESKLQFVTQFLIYLYTILTFCLPVWTSVSLIWKWNTPAGHQTSCHWICDVYCSMIALCWSGRSPTSLTFYPLFVFVRPAMGNSNRKETERNFSVEGSYCTADSLSAQQ